MIKYGIMNRAVVPVFSEANTKSASDEGLYGNMCRILNEQDGFFYVISSYGYAGWVKTQDILAVDEDGLKFWMKDLRVTDGTCTDILSAPTVHGERIDALPRGAVVKAVQEAPEGYTQVLMADGRTGYAVSFRLMDKKYNESLLYAAPEDLIARQKEAVSRREIESGGDESFCFKDFLDNWYAVSFDDNKASTEEKETAFRKSLTSNARKYLGVQYRWGGRSSFGIDCSGLTHLSYLLSGVHIFRDAAIVRGYPLKKIPVAFNNGRFSLENLENGVLKEGDALYFPGHVAMYIEDGIYIHSTGKAGDMGVVYNSLKPGHELFREDLLDKLYAVGGLR